MKIVEVRKKSIPDLKKEAVNIRDAIAKIEVDKFATESKNVRLKQSFRKDLARILTVLNEETAPETKEEVNEVTKNDDKENK